jgi:hypothetical protein
MENSNRRRFGQVGLVGLASAFLDTPGLFAETLTATPEQTEVLIRRHFRSIPTMTFSSLITFTGRRADRISADAFSA